jgi:hypothetical protein
MLKQERDKRLTETSSIVSLSALRQLRTGTTRCARHIAPLSFFLLTLETTLSFAATDDGIPGRVLSYFLTSTTFYDTLIRCSISHVFGAFLRLLLTVRRTHREARRFAMPLHAISSLSVTGHVSRAMSALTSAPSTVTSFLVVPIFHSLVSSWHEVGNMVVTRIHDNDTVHLLTRKTVMKVTITISNLFDALPAAQYLSMLSKGTSYSEQNRTYRLTNVTADVPPLTDTADPTQPHPPFDPTEHYTASRANSTPRRGKSSTPRPCCAVSANYQTRPEVTTLGDDLEHRSRKSRG